jgi:hypothetical protein
MARLGRFPTLAPHPWHREVRPEPTFLTFNFDVSLLFAIGFANVFVLGWLESIADPPMGRNRLLSGDALGRALPGLGAEAFFRVEPAFLGPAETCRLILTRREPSTASAFGATQLRRGIWEARIRRNLRPGLSLGRRRVRRIGCKCHSRHRYCVQQCRLERLDHRRLSHQQRSVSPDKMSLGRF